jgi:polyisoprenoid-binding protein YceI
MTKNPNMIKKLSFVFIGIAFIVMSFALIQSWNIAPNNTVAFKIKALAGTVDGTIGGLKGTVSFDPNNLAGTSLDVSLDVSTIKTGNNKRDKDIIQEDTWFDAAKYPAITFKSSAVTKTASGYTVDGTLTIKGISKKVQIPFTFAATANGGTFSGTLHLIREDYNVGKSSSMVKDDVDATITVPVKK